jgi:signal peptidase II
MWRERLSLPPKNPIVKVRQVVFIILLILLADQALKIYIKTHYHLGENHNMLGSWFELHFVENKGMAWGWEFGGNFGKLFLTLFRLFAVFFGVYYIRKIVRERQSRGFIVCVALIFAGAVGNLIDSLFYGMIFTESPEHTLEVAKMVTPGNGYGGFLHGKVVDMLHFPLFKAHWPQWMPWVGGDQFEFFGPVFNIADAAISVGVITILVFQNRFFNKKKDKSTPVVETNAPVNDSVQIL